MQQSYMECGLGRDAIVVGWLQQLLQLLLLLGRSSSTDGWTEERTRMLINNWFWVLCSNNELQPMLCANNMDSNITRFKHHMIQTSHDSSIIWFKHHMIQTSYDVNIIWFKHHIIQSSYDSNIIWFKHHMIQTSYDSSIIRFKLHTSQASYDSIIIWFKNHTPHAASIMPGTRSICDKLFFKRTMTPALSFIYTSTILLILSIWSNSLLSLLVKSANSFLPWHWKSSFIPSSFLHSFNVVIASQIIDSKRTNIFCEGHSTARKGRFSGEVSQANLRHSMIYPSQSSKVVWKCWNSFWCDRSLRHACYSVFRPALEVKARLSTCWTVFLPLQYRYPTLWSFSRTFHLFSIFLQGSLLRPILFLMRTNYKMRNMNWWVSLLCSQLGVLGTGRVTMGDRELWNWGR